MDPSRPAPHPVFAILIDGDNVPPDALKAALDEVGRAGGEARVRLVFGNGEKLKGMKEAANALGYRPVLHFALAGRKNGVDVALAVAAMDLLHAGDVGSFCIASSDSDFHPLALRLREAGRYVLGMGSETTPEALRAACHRFVVVGPRTAQGEEKEALAAAPAARVSAPSAIQVPVQQARPALKSEARLRSLLVKAYQNAAGQDGWVHLSSLGTQIRAEAPDFKPSTYGRRLLGLLVEDVGIFEVRVGPGSTTKYVRLRP